MSDSKKKDAATEVIEKLREVKDRLVKANEKLKAASK